jgi:hypothetical protein
MIAAVRPQADFLRRHEALLNDAPFRTDVLLFLPFRRWVDTGTCIASRLAADLAKANVQFRVICEDNFELASPTQRLPIFVVESRSVFTPIEKTIVSEFEQQGGRLIAADSPEWLAQVRGDNGSHSLSLEGLSTVRAVVHDQPQRTIVHLYNLHVERQSSFEDKVTPAADLKLRVRVPFEKVSKVTVHTADDGSSSGPLQFSTTEKQGDTFVETTVPSLKINCLIVIEP